MQRLNTLSALLLFWSTSCWSGEEVQGIVEWVDRIELGTPISGVIDKVFVKSGQTVKQGELLVQIDKRKLLAQRDAAQAAVDMHEAERKETARERDRSVELYDQTLLSDHDLNLAKIAYSKAEADFQKARATLIDVRLQLEYAQMRAPYDAVVLSVPAYDGQAVANLTVITPLVTLARKGAIQVMIYLDESQRASVQADTKLNVTISGKSVAGTVSASIHDVTKSDNRSLYPVSILVYGLSDMSIRAGQTATVELP